MTDSAQWDEVLTPILEDLYRLEAGLAAMKRECLRLEDAGMWPAVPSFNWEARGSSTHGEKRYLRLEFPAGTPGLDELESDRCRLYVGCDPARIRAARKKAANRRQWEELDGEITRLERYLRMRRGDLKQVAGMVGRYELPEGLVTGDHSLSVPVVTKEEWILTGPPELEWNLGSFEGEGAWADALALARRKAAELGYQVVQEDSQFEEIRDASWDDEDWHDE